MQNRESKKVSYMRHLFLVIGKCCSIVVVKCKLLSKHFFMDITLTFIFVINKI